MPMNKISGFKSVTEVMRAVSDNRDELISLREMLEEGSVKTPPSATVDGETQPQAPERKKAVRKKARKPKVQRSA